MKTVKNDELPEEALWRFEELRQGQPERNPHEAELFRTTTEPETLVREFIQNALDARLGSEQVCIRFTLGTAKKSDVKRYFDGLSEHLEACDLEFPRFPELRFLTIEDFGTTGLDGDTGETGKRPDSNFFNFWWREGISNKTGIKAGRWGLGKTAFHIASELRTVWGLTVRQDDNRELLMGKALLLTHDIRDKKFNYFGYFRTDSVGGIENSKIITDFKQNFYISRKKSEPGLSLVIPMQLTDINSFSIIGSSIINYFYPILNGTLIIEIREGNYLQILNADNLIEVAQTQQFHDTDWADRDKHDILETLQFAKDSIRIENMIDISLSDSEFPEIAESSFGQSLDSATKSFAEGKICAFRVPVAIKELKKANSIESSFKVYLKKCPELNKSDEFYVRSGITLSNFRQIGNRPVRALFVADEAAVAQFLGDCETPSHDEWNERTEKFKERYENATTLLRFIRKSMPKIVSIIDHPPEDILQDLLAHIFSVPENIPLGKSDRVTRGPIVIVPKQPQIFETAPVKNGFMVSLNKGTSLPIRASVRVAYDVRRKNPFAQYDKNDFDLSRDPIKTVSKGCKIERKEGNTIELADLEKSFALEVTGFDPKRDLIIDVKVLE